MSDTDDVEHKAVRDGLSLYLALDAAAEDDDAESSDIATAIDAETDANRSIYARCDAAMALTPKLATSPDVAWAFDEAARLARGKRAGIAPRSRWLDRIGVAWSAAAGALAVAATLGVALVMSHAPESAPDEAVAAGPNITFAPMIIPADVVTQLAQVDPVVLIGNQVPVDGRSLALLPFSVEASAENTDTTSIDRTAVAIYDRLVQQLAAIPGLYVIEPTIAAAYADTELTPAEIAAYLGVRAVVEGRIRSEGDSVTLGLRFTDAAGDGASIDRTFDATPAEFPRLGSDVTVSLLDVLSIPRTLTIDRTL